ncbi:MAG: hypothetical protein LBC20_10340 [Planctomycetaceae bacterium]|nr:hypothetical protein [Planctomycetaceae bacterium]
MFINQGRGNSYGYSNYRRTRTSSNHSGIVLAAMRSDINKSEGNEVKEV